MDKNNPMTSILVTGGTLNLCRLMQTHNVFNMVFSSSATVYGETAASPVTEDSPLSPTNPYGRTKRMIEMILQDIAASNPAFKVSLLRYFNPVGAHESGLIGEDPRGIPNNLMPYISQVAVGRLPRLNVFGSDYPTPDGTGIRDYIHVMDLAEGHVNALEHIDKTNKVTPYNLGTGKGYSVLELIRAFENASGRNDPTPSSTAAPEMWKSYMPTPQRPTQNWPGGQHGASKPSVPTHGDGSPKIRTDMRMQCHKNIIDNFPPDRL